MPVLPHFRRFPLARRDHHHAAVAHAAFGDDVVGEMPDFGGVAAQRGHLHAIVVIEMDVQGREREVMVTMEFLHQAF
ncbi:hypothetical protein ACVWY3_006189 [Bradyrhizobium sp. USDA 4486]